MDSFKFFYCHPISSFYLFIHSLILGSNCHSNVDLSIWWELFAYLTSCLPGQVKVLLTLLL